ncbi:MAG: hypothetical protein EBS01_11510, partial [Verrucomicrobia bacterium]|nr:hypothetical protein [Verrucomicrobiota bacterium]
MAHPNIVPIYNLGEDSSGRPFYSMKLIRGRTLMQVIRLLANGDETARAKYTLNRLITIFRKVCDGVAFAHSKGYLHRDIKPENVMLGEFGEVLVMDWGLAQKISPSPSEASAVTEAELREVRNYVEGTPEYMSPEQTRGEPLDVRSDVYSLGGLLHTLLSYGPPVRAKSVPELLLKVRRGEIQPIRKPRINASMQAAGLKNHGVPIALQAVTRKAMAVQRERRYQNVEELARDIEAYQNGFATTAEVAGLFRQISLFLQRQLVASALVALLLLGAVLFVARLTASEREARQNAEWATQEAQRANLSAAEARKQTEIAAANARQVLEEQKIARRSAAAANLTMAEAAEEDANGHQMLTALSQVPDDLKDQNWHYLDQKLDTSDLQIEAEEGGSWKDCVAHPVKLDLLLTLQSNGWIRSLNLSSGAMEDLFRINASGLKNRLAVSPDGQRVAVYRRLAPPGGQILQVDVHSLSDGELLCSATLPISRQPRDSAPLVFSPDGNLLLLSSTFSGSGVYMFDAWNGNFLWKSDDDATAFAGFSSAGDSALVVSSKSGFSEREVWTGRVLRSNPKAKNEGNRLIQTPTPSWSHIFSLIAGAVRKIEVETGVVVDNYPVKSGVSFQGDIAYLPDTKTLAVLSDQFRQSSCLQIWSADKATLLRSVPVLMNPSGIKKPEEFRWAIVAAPQTNQLIVMRGTHMKIWKIDKVVPEQSFPTESNSGFDNFVFLGKSLVSSGGVVTSDFEGRLVCSTMKWNESGASTLRLRQTGAPRASDLEIPLEKPLVGHAHLSPKGERVWCGGL